jgi:hypothetical protein
MPLDVPVGGGTDDDQVEASLVPPPRSAAGVASNLSDVLRAAPIFGQSPAISLALAHLGGNVVGNAQAVGAVAHTRALDTAAQRLMADEEAHLSDVEPAPAQPHRPPTAEVHPSPGVLGELTGAVTGAVHATTGAVSAVSGALDTGLEKARHGVASYAKSLPGSAETVAGDVKGAFTPHWAPPQEGATGIVFTGPAKALGSDALGILNTPTHLYRTWTDIEHKHGPAAMVEAMVPSLLGAGAGYFLTHSPEGVQTGAEEGAALVTGAEDTGAEAATAEAPAATAAKANAAQRTGQIARTVTKAVAKPVVVPAGSLMRVASAVSSSPSFLGANVGGMAESRLSQSFKNSWDLTAHSSPRGEVGSFGRFIAGGVESAGRAVGLPGMQPHSMFFNALSGGLDAFSNIALLDPLGAAGRVVGQARSAEGLSGPLGKLWGGMHISSPDDVDRILTQYPGARAFVNDVKDLSAGQILYKYGMKDLNGPLAERLGAATTTDQVVNVLKDSARTVELATTTGKMPTLGSYIKARSALGETKIGSALTVPLPTMYEEDLAKFTGREFTAGDPNAVESIMHLMRSIGEPPDVVTNTGTILLETSDPRRWATILANVSKVALQRQVVKAIGTNQLSDIMAGKISDAAEQLFGGRGAGFIGKFASDYKGENLSFVMSKEGEVAQRRAAGLGFNQAGRMVMPTVRDVQKVAKDIASVVKWSSANGVYAKGQNLRDWLDVMVNHKFFQPLALATGGWALRVSSSEMLLNALRLGPLNFSAARIAASAAKHDLAIGVIQTDSRVLADMEKADRLAERAIQSSTASNAATRAATNLTRNVVAAVRGVMAGTDESLLKGIGRERYLDAATKLIMLHDGYMLPPGISAVHNLPLVGQDEVARKESDITAWREQFGRPRKIRNVTVNGQYHFLSPEEPGYFSEWSAHAGLISADKRFWQPLAQAYRDALDAGMTDEAATANAITHGKHILEDIPEKDRAYMLRDVASSPDATTDPLTDWSMQALRGIKGATTSQFGVTHRELLNDIADGTVPPTAKQMMEKYGNKASEHYVAPEDLPHAIPGRGVNQDHFGGFQRAASFMHTKVFGRVVNYLSREPTFIADFAQESKLLETQVKEGTITQDQADVLAQTRAIFKSIRFVHNPQDRMKIEQSVHVIAPFYFAKNQAIRRAGRLLAENPGAFEQYLKLNLAVQNISYTLNQKNGQSSFVFPGSAVIGKEMTGLLGHIGLFPTGSIPIGLSGSADAMQTMVPWSGNGEQAAGSPESLFAAIGNPDLGPLGAMPVKGVADFTSGFTATGAHDILGPIGSNTPWWSNLVPNSILQHFAEDVAFTGGSESLGTSANSALLSAIASVADASKSTGALARIVPSDITGAPPAPADTAINAVEQAKLIKQVKNLTSVMLIYRMLVSGASPVSVTLQRADLKFSDEVQAYINRAGGNVSTGIDKFMAANPDAVASTVYQSTSNVGSGWGTTAKDGAFIEAHKALIDKYPNAAQWLIPPADNVGPFSESTHLLEIAENLRHVDTPQEFLTNIYVAAGNAWYYNDVRPQMEAALKANPSESYKIYNEYDQFIANYSKRNPEWGVYWNAQQSSATRGQSLDQLRALLADPAAPHNQQTQRLGALISGYDHYLAAKTNAASAVQRADLKAGWQNELNATIKEWPDVAPAITDLFIHLS